jgi:Tol biopolymer transport system component
VIGEILHGVANSGMDQGFRRALGITMEELSNDWQDAVRRTYLPQITDLQLPRQFSKAALTEEKSTGQVHVSPSISPDGSQIAYLSEGSTFFIDLYLADAESGRVKGRLIKSAFSVNNESLRTFNSAGSWSPDGRYFAIAVKHGGQDDLVIFDVKRRREHKRFKVALNGLTNPSWSPDGKQIVFTGYDNGVTDLFILTVDGGAIQRLSHDKFADLHPNWSPDGKTIALATDRGFPTDTAKLKYSAPRIGLYHVDTQQFEELPGMVGSNINPQWAPDGKSIAFVSDRDGTANLYLYDLGDRQVYQLTKVYTGIGTFSPLAPVISWARGADRLVFTYYEKGPFRYNVYAIDNPRSLKRDPWREPAGGVPIASLMKNAPPKFATAPITAQIRSVRAAADSIRRDTVAALRLLALGDSIDAGGTSVYRDPSGFRASAETPAATLAGGEPVSVKALLDSATLALPDTAEFGFKKYSSKLSTDFVARPSVGYTRDNFGNGVYGGGGISFSDILGNRRLLLAGQVNGRIEEAVIQAIYANLGHRTYWLNGYEQYPVFFFTGSEFGVDSTNGRSTFNTRLERLLYHTAFFQSVHPFNRFRRLELGVRASYVTRANQDYVQYFDPTTRLVYAARIDTRKTGDAAYIQPTIGLTFDNSISEWVGPTMGRRSHFEYAPAIGGHPFHEITADYRRYDQPLHPFTIATRALFIGRFGGDTAFQYNYFLGFPEFLRGYTGGSFRRNECLSQRPEEILICDDLDQMIGSRLALFNAELRFPLLRGLALGLIPIGFPPIEGAVFFDAGMAWDQGSTIVWPWDGDRDPAANKRQVRTPLKSYGFSIRANLGGVIILRLDWTRPLDRPAYKKGYWTLNIGPTF